eukprot:3147150-Rhodomonas_salina.1
MNKHACTHANLREKELSRLYSKRFARAGFKEYDCGHTFIFSGRASHEPLWKKIETCSMGWDHHEPLPFAQPKPVTFFFTAWHFNPVLRRHMHHVQTADSRHAHLRSSCGWGSFCSSSGPGLWGIVSEWRGAVDTVVASQGPPRIKKVYARQCD